MPALPDPRRYPQGARHPLLDLPGEGELLREMERLLATHQDEEVHRALGAAPGREAYSRLWNALCVASEASGARGETVATRVFAIPVVIVSGARQRATLAAVLPEVEALAEVLRRCGALGATRNFGLGNALCSLEALERLPPSAIRDWSLPDASSKWPRAVAPAPIELRAGEEAHLRFLLGAAVAPADAPSVTETAAHIGAWGLQFTRELGRQIAAAGVELLALPRPPAGVLRAVYAGRKAQLEVALNLFLSNAIKRFRAAAGEPTLVLSTHVAGRRGGELRVALSAELDDTLLEGYRWPLHPLDDLGEIAGAVRQLAADCRILDVREVEEVHPEGGGMAPLFVRGRDAPRARH